MTDDTTPSKSTRPGTKTHMTRVPIDLWTAYKKAANIRKEPHTPGRATPNMTGVTIRLIREYVGATKTDEEWATEAATRLQEPQQ